MCFPLHACDFAKICILPEQQKKRSSDNISKVLSVLIFKNVSRERLILWVEKNVVLCISKEVSSGRDFLKLYNNRRKLEKN